MLMQKQIRVWSITSRNKRSNFIVIIDFMAASKLIEIN